TSIWLHSSARRDAPILLLLPLKLWAARRITSASPWGTSTCRLRTRSRESVTKVSISSMKSLSITSFSVVSISRTRCGVVLIECPQHTNSIILNPGKNCLDFITHAEITHRVAQCIHQRESPTTVLAVGQAFSRTVALIKALPAVFHPDRQAAAARRGGMLQVNTDVPRRYLTQSRLALLIIPGEAFRGILHG